MVNHLTIAFLLVISCPGMAKTRSEPIQPIEEFTFDASLAGKIELGKMLFFEPRLSSSGNISCASCHNLGTGGVDNLAGSIGHGWHIGDTNAPTVFNSRLNIAQFWDGRAKNLKEQAGGPIANPKEMASSHQLAVRTLQSLPGYRIHFRKAYGDAAVTIDRITDAIAMFEKTLMTPNSRFDRWLTGDDAALTASEKAGYDLFKSKGCIGCHNGPGVGGGSYQKFGIVKPWRLQRALGRYNVTKSDSDKYVFKVPMLRNVELTAPYFHDGSVWTLEEAVAVMAEFQLGMKLNAFEVSNIVAFLKSLTGEQPKVTQPILPPRAAKTPIPNLSH